MEQKPSREAEEMAALCIDAEKIQVFDQETKSTIIF